MHVKVIGTGIKLHNFVMFIIIPSLKFNSPASKKQVNINPFSARLKNNFLNIVS